MRRGLPAAGQSTGRNRSVNRDNVGCYTPVP
jgi:hypothetical protein